MVQRSDENQKGFLDAIREDRYVLIVAVAILIFIASSSIALVSTAPQDVIAPVPEVSATVDGAEVSLSWNASKTAAVTGYDVYRSDRQGVLGAKLNAAPIAGLAYKDTVLAGTYYYTLRALANSTDDGNNKQLEVRVEEIIPAGLSITINEGGNYATSKTVTLHLSAKDAKECRYKNDDDPDWGAWGPYMVAKIWTLSAGGDGERIVAYQCRNSGESNIALATVTLDENAPIVVYTITPYAGAVQINLVVKDAVSPTAKCDLRVDGAAEPAVIQLSSGVGSKVYYQAQLSAGEHTFSVRCTDEAGNVKSTAEQKVAVQ